MAYVVNDSESAALLTLPEHKIKIAQVRQQLDSLWESLHQDLADGQAVTRACMSNLIIYCEGDEQAASISRAIPGIVQNHPSRIIFLIGTGQTSEPGIEVFVSGHYCALNSGWQVCSEQIRVVSDGFTSRRLPSVTRSQLIGDLPTTLWWAALQPPPFAGKLFYKLASMADQIIYDSYNWNNPSKGIQAMARWVAAEKQEHVIFNLSWRRLKPWRSLLSQVLDPQIKPGALQNVTQLRIEHGPHALGMALLLLGWLASRLNWEPIEGRVALDKETVWHFTAHGRQIPARVVRLGGGEPTLHRMHWYWRTEQQSQHIEFSRLSDGRLGIVEDTSDVPTRVVAAPPLRRSALVAAQMAHRTRDKLFEEALEVGNTMASILEH